MGNLRNAAAWAIPCRTRGVGCANIAMHSKSSSAQVRDPASLSARRMALGRSTINRNIRWSGYRGKHPSVSDMSTNASLESVEVDMGGQASGTLYLHYPCFDGLASAAIARDFLETQSRWSIEQIKFVNYDAQAGWLMAPLPRFSAVVDFLYHPDAEFWADHHGTTFVTDEARLHFDGHAHGRTLLYDRTSPSCAMLMWKAFRPVSSNENLYGALAHSANRIDSAAYDSVGEAIYGWANPAAEINLSLSHADENYGAMLLGKFGQMALSDVAALPDVRARVDVVRQRAALGLALLRDHIHLTDGSIAVADITPPSDVTVNRYSPYAVFPDALYSVVLTRMCRDARLTAMRNPWRNFDSVDLGAIFRHHGGGGHQRVGSTVLRIGDSRDPAEVLYAIVEEIHHGKRRQAASEPISA
jgi:hypothetical protein